MHGPQLLAQGAGRPSNIEKDFQAFKERLNTKAVAPLNAIKNQGKEEGTVDRPFDPAELPEVAAADKACRTAMRFMRKLDRLRGNFDPRDSEADATAASTKNAATAALEACAAGAPLYAARAAVDAARSAYGLAAQAATANSVARKSAERDACEELNSAVEAAVTAVAAALAAHKKASARRRPFRRRRPARSARLTSVQRKLDVQLARAARAANALDDESTKGTSAVATDQGDRGQNEGRSGKKITDGVRCVAVAGRARGQ